MEFGKVSELVKVKDRKYLENCLDFRSGYDTHVDVFFNYIKVENDQTLYEDLDMKFIPVVVRTEDFYALSEIEQYLADNEVEKDA